MSSVLIVGTVAFDSVKTPFGKVDNVLGGSASYAATSASFFCKPRILSVAGEDFPQEHLDFFSSKQIDTTGIKKEGKTFRWEGFYEYDMNEAKTLKTELNSLATFTIDLPPSYKDSEYVFLANIDPVLQQEVIKQLDNPKRIILDTMNFWIDSKKDELINTIKLAHVLVINDGEARQLFDTTNLVKAAHQALALGPEAVIIKKGEHGALMFTKDKHFSAPSYPLEDIKDPTGCGDSFGGALIGYLAQSGNHEEKNLRKAIMYGTVLASHNAEDFSLNRLKQLSKEDIEKRYSQLQEIREF